MIHSIRRSGFVLFLTIPSFYLCWYRCQASSYALDAKGKTPMFSNLKKKMAIRKSARDSFQEQDKIVKFICSQSNTSFSNRNGVDRTTNEACFKFIITRPSDLVWDRPSRKKLAASKSVSTARVSGLFHFAFVVFTSVAPLGLTRSIASIFSSPDHSPLQILILPNFH